MCYSNNTKRYCRTVRIFVLTLSFIALFIFLSQAQDSRISFQSIENGLSNPHVKCILKDSKGFMWFGTNEGLNKFDGTSFSVYENDQSDSSSILNNTINALLEDTNQNLWIGTGVGVCIYNREKDNFKQFRDLGTIYISSLYEDQNKNIWIGTLGAGLFVYDPKMDSVYNYFYYTEDNNSVTSNFINSIAADSHGRIWLGNRNGLNVFDKSKNKFVRFQCEHPLYKDISTGFIKRLTVDQNGDLWIGTYGNGIYNLQFKNDNWNIRQYKRNNQPGSLSNNDILTMISDNKGYLWVGTENGGLNVLPPQSDQFSVYKTIDGDANSISSNSIWSLYHDNTGILWIGTFNHGLNFVDEKIKKFDVYQRNSFQEKTLIDNNVMNFSEDINGTIWIATDGGGVSTFNPDDRSFTNIINNNGISSKAIMAILCDSKQRVWIGTWGGGLDVYDLKGKKLKNYELSAYNRLGNILSLYEDKNKNIWIGSAGKSLLKYLPETDSFKQVFDTSGVTHLSYNTYINTIFQDSENNFWIGIPYSLIRIKNIEGEPVFTEFKPTTDTSSISSSNIITVFEDSRHNIWVGTDNGLNLFNKNSETFTIFTKKEGLLNNAVNGILEDQEQNLWISTYGGISKFDPESNTFKNYTKEDGLLSNSLNPRSCMKTSSGEFFFGGNSGFFTFMPDSIRINDYIPPVYFTNLKIFNTPVSIGAKDSPLTKSISETRQITLNHKQTSFTIEFVALNYTHSAKNQYAYILEGFDKTWNYVGTQQYATYTNIDAGKYIFKVCGSNNEGIWNENPIQLEIVVLPPIWKTAWAYTLYFITITLILFAFIKLWIIKSSQAEKLRLEKIHHEKSEELNRMKLQFFTNISHEFRTPLSLILAPLKQTIEGEPLKPVVKKRLELIFRNANKMYGLVNELMDFTKSEEGRLKMMVQQADLVDFSSEIYSLFEEEAAKRGIDYAFDTQVDKLEVWIDKNKMEKIITNLLSNAFKFTPDNGKITLKIQKDYSFATITVIDNGVGISEEHINKVFDRFFQSPEKDNKNITGTGIGLALVKSLVELHHGTVSVTSKKNEDTCFEVRIPFGKAHFNAHELLDENSEFLPTKSGSSHKTSANENKHDNNVPSILIVEDNDELREYLVSILKTKYKVSKAANGEEGLAIAQETIPDLILSDVAMPRLSGTELCKIIKSDISTSHIPVILLTAKTATSDMIEGIGTGADAYITKPFDLKHLEVSIEKIIETRRKLYQRYSQDVFIIPSESTNNELDKKFLENIVDYIERNVADNNLSVENLASHLLMSRTNVYRKIKALTGQTATEFIRIARLKMSLKFIEDGQLNISEIAYKVGFSSPGYYAKCFKDQYGKSPSDFIISKNRQH